MTCKLKRLHLTSSGIFSKLIAGSSEFCILEHAYPTQQGTYAPKVAAGVYECVRHSPHKLSYETFMLKDVPDFNYEKVEGILIHVGNFQEDSEGCLLIGQRMQLDYPARVIDSNKAFKEFMALQEDCDNFILSIS